MWSDIGSMDAQSHLTDDFGIDLFKITELLSALEERFGVDGRNCGRTPHALNFE
jgi:acyl carrier protein